MADSEAPKVDVLLALLRLFTVEQLMFLVNNCETAIRVTGYARVEIVFENGHFAFIYPAPGLRAPKPIPPNDYIRRGEKERRGGAS